MSAADLQTGLLEPGAVDPENPWPGLLPFNEADKDFFRGRERQVDELYTLTRRSRLAVLCGLSGLGKSSLLKAGLFPLLRKQRILPVYIRLDYKSVPLNLSAQVSDAIQSQAVAAGIEAPDAQAGATLWEYFHRKDADFWDSRNRPVTPMLVFDQWEEIFTLGRETLAVLEATRRFLAEFADFAEGSVPKVVEERLKNPAQAEEFSFDSHPYDILLSVREDFLADLESMQPKISGLALNRMRLQRMTGEAALLAVNQAPHLIAPDVAEQVVRFVGARSQAVPLDDLEIEPALLSLVCRELNERRKEAELPKITASLLAGNLEGVLRQFYEESFEGLSPSVRPYIEENLLNKDGFRDSESMANVRAAAGITMEDIAHLIDRRLVRIENLGGERLELTHDRLTDVVRASRDTRHAAEDKAKQEAQRAAELARKEQARLEAESARLAAEQKARRNRQVALALLVLALVAGGLAVYAFSESAEIERQRNEANKQRDEANKQRDAQVRQRRIADRARGDAETAQKKALEAEVIAKTAADEALKQKRQADAQRANAITAAELANQERVSAANARDAEEAAKKDAVTEANHAREAAQIAEDAKKQVVSQNQEIASKSTALGVSLAKSDVSEAVRRLELDHRADEALTYLSRALLNDPGSLAARSLVFDILLRGTVHVPDAWHPGSPVPFEHAAVMIGKDAFSAMFSPPGVQPQILVGCRQGIVRLVSGNQSGNFTFPVNSAVFSPDGRLVAIASHNGNALVWNPATGKTITLAHGGPVMTASFSHSRGKLLIVTASWDQSARVWDAETGAQQGEPLRHTAPVTSASFSQNDELIVTSSWDGQARIWDAKSRKVTLTIAHSGSGIPVNKTQLNWAEFDTSSPPRRIVTAGAGFARIWDSSGRPVGKPLEHQKEVNCARFDAESRRIVTASSDRTARVWDAETGEGISLPLSHGDAVTSAAFSSDGLRIVTASLDKTVRVWEVRSAASPSDVSLLRDMAEYAGGFDIRALPNLTPLQNRHELLDKIRSKMDGAEPNSNAAAAFRWFLSRNR